MELESELKFSNYERSEEFKTQYYEPFVNAYGAGRSKVASLNILDPETGTQRKGTPEDFDFIMQIGDDDAAAEKAQEMFGAKAPIVMYHRERVSELNDAKVKASEKYRKEGNERETQREESMRKGREEVAQTFNKAVLEGIEKYPKLFKAIEGDEKGSKILEEGFLNADIAFGTQSKDADGNPIRMDAKTRAAKHAAIRNMAGAFPYVVHLMKQAQAKAKELETKLAEFDKSQPGQGSGGRGKGAPNLTPMQQAEKGIEALVTGRR